MNPAERIAWRLLVSLGATKLMIRGNHALCLGTITITSGSQMALFCYALIDVIGTSGNNRRHLNWRGYPAFVITYYLEDPALDH